MAESAAVTDSRNGKDTEQVLASENYFNTNRPETVILTKEETHLDYFDSYRETNSSYDENDTGDDDEDHEDPYMELFMDAYRSAPASSDEEEDEKQNNNSIQPAAKPLCLMEDFDLWDYMDESELQERLKDHPQLLEVITRKRKRMILEEEGSATSNDELCDMMNRTKCFRIDPTSLSS